MAFLKVTRIRKGRYFYVVKAVRRDGKVRQVTLEYLGRDPDPARLKRALDYWGVKKPGRGKERH